MSMGMGLAAVQESAKAFVAAVYTWPVDIARIKTANQAFNDTAEFWLNKTESFAIMVQAAAILSLFPAGFVTFTLPRDKVKYQKYREDFHTAYERFMLSVGLRPVSYIDVLKMMATQASI